MTTATQTEEQRFAGFMNKGKQPCDYERQLMEKHFDRVMYIRGGGFPPPVELEMQPSSICNLACSHCFGRFCEKLPNKIHRKEMAEIARQVSEFRQDGFEIETIKFCVTTGEPLVNPETMPAIQLFKGLGKKIVVFTNGLWLDKKTDEGKPYYEYILGADSLRLSLDAGSEETFTHLKKRTGFRRTITGLAKLLVRRAETGSTLNVTIGYVIGTENYHDIVQATRLMRDLEVDEIRFRVDFTNLAGVKGLSSLILENLDKAKQYENPDFNVNSVYTENEITSNDSAFSSYGTKCFNHHFWACIGPDAELYACGHRTFSGVESYGSLLEHPIQELWESQERLESVAGLPDEHCETCSPSSVRRNTFMEETSSYSGKKLAKLKKKHV